jgi:hypothetical protein
MQMSTIAGDGLKGCLFNHYCNVAGGTWWCLMIMKKSMMEVYC